jgi:hypothetical protein
MLSLSLMTAEQSVHLFGHCDTNPLQKYSSKTVQVVRTFTYTATSVSEREDTLDTRHCEDAMGAAIVARRAAVFKTRD